MSLARILFYSLVDGLITALLGAVIVVSFRTVENRWLDGGLEPLPLLTLGDQFGAFLVPVLGIAVLAALVAVLVRGLSRFGLLAQGSAVWLATASFLVMTYFPHRLVPALAKRSPQNLAIWLSDQQLQWRAQEPLLWLWAAVLILVLLVARVFADSASRAGKLLRRWIPLAAIVLSLGVLAIPAIYASLVDPAPTRRNVLLVVLDTVAAGHMRVYGYARDTTPELEALAKRGTLFAHAYTVAGWTLPSHASMFTGVWPVRHGATQERVRLDLSWNTLAEILRSEGYRTFAAAGNPVVSSITQLDQGFTQFVPTWRKDVASAYRGTGQHPNNAAVLRFLDSLDRDEHFFAFLNYNDAHAPYAPPEPYRSRFLPKDVTAERIREINQNWRSYYVGQSRLGPEELDILRALYDAELSRLSKVVADLVMGLEERRLLHNTLVIITADHGENVGDHGHLDHVFNLYDTVLRVPLFIFGAGTEAAFVDDRPVSVADIFLTVLAAAGSSWSRAEGPTRNLLAMDASDSRPVEMVAEYYFPNQALSTFDTEMLQGSRAKLTPYLRRLRALRTESWKLIWASDGRHELYAITEDPQETANRSEHEAPRVVLMEQRLEELLTTLKRAPFRFVDEPPPPEIAGFEDANEEMIERLRSLGYVR
jgi:arylsulfatase A-like enzyme